MGKDTKIQWAHDSWSPWIGCTKVSQGCKNCYAEALTTRRPRWANSWGPEGKRVRTSESYWQKPRSWNKSAMRKNTRYRVFPSLCDPFEDRPELEPWRVDFVRLIEDTTYLDWMLLTKRPENVLRLIELASGTKYSTWNGVDNTWIGVSVEDQETADERIPELLKIPAALRFLSCEPLLGSIDLRHLQKNGEVEIDSLAGTYGVYRPHRGRSTSVDLVIIGGESGPNARPMDLAWARDIVRQCRTAGVPVFMKQLGARPMLGPGDTFALNPIQITDPKGGDPSEWPEDLRIREFPESPLEEIQPSLL